MQLLSAIMVGLLIAGGIYMILQRGFVRILFGFSLLTHATNVFILAMSGEPGDKVSPIITGQVQAVDPLPQALILTAIVIGFGVSAYLVIMLYRLFKDNNTTDIQKVFEKDETNSC